MTRKNVEVFFQGHSPSKDDVDLLREALDERNTRSTEQSSRSRKLGRVSSATTSTSNVATKEKGKKKEHSTPAVVNAISSIGPSTHSYKRKNIPSTTPSVIREEE